MCTHIKTFVGYPLIRNSCLTWIRDRGIARSTSPTHVQELLTSYRTPSPAESRRGGGKNGNCSIFATGIALLSQEAFTTRDCLRSDPEKVVTGTAVVFLRKFTKLSTASEERYSSDPRFLLDGRRRVVYRSQSPKSALGFDLSNVQMLSALDGQNTAVVRVKSAFDGVERVYGLARVGASGYVVMVGVPSEVLYASAWRQLTGYALVGLIVVFCTMTGAPHRAEYRRQVRL